MDSLGIRNDIWDLQGAVTQLGDAIEYGHLENAEQLRKLYASVREIAVALNVTLDVLAKAGVVDLQIVRQRVADQLAPPRPDVTCVTCGRLVPARSTSTTPLGSVCSSCAG